MGDVIYIILNHVDSICIISLWPSQILRINSLRLTPSTINRTIPISTLYIEFHVSVVFRQEVVLVYIPVSYESSHGIVLICAFLGQIVGVDEVGGRVGCVGVDV